MRIMTRRVAGLDPVGWDSKARAEVVEEFDSLAPEWHTRTSSQRTAVVLDAFERGLGGNTADGHLAIEVGSGIGSYSELIADRFDSVLSVDVSAEMVRHAPAGPTFRVQADSGLLPISDRSADAVIAIKRLSVSARGCPGPSCRRNADLGQLQRRRNSDPSIDEGCGRGAAVPCGRGGKAERALEPGACSGGLRDIHTDVRFWSEQ